MARGNQPIYAVKLSAKSCLLLLNALVPKKLLYPAKFLQGFPQNLLTTFKNELSWAVLGCFIS